MLSDVVQRCPNCGRIQAERGACEACGEPEVRHYCPNHVRGLWLDGPACPSCGAPVLDGREARERAARDLAAREHAAREVVERGRREWAARMSVGGPLHAAEPPVEHAPGYASAEPLLPPAPELPWRRQGRATKPGDAPPAPDPRRTPHEPPRADVPRPEVPRPDAPRPDVPYAGVARRPVDPRTPTPRTPVPAVVVIPPPEPARAPLRLPKLSWPRAPRAPRAPSAPRVPSAPRLPSVRFRPGVWTGVVAAVLTLVGLGSGGWWLLRDHAGARDLMVELGQRTGLVGGVPRQTERGIVALARGDTAVGERELLEAADRYPRSALALVHLARVSLALGDEERARLQLAEAVAREPDDAAANRELAGLLLARARRAMSDDDETTIVGDDLLLAEQHYRRALQLNPADRAAHGYYACVLAALDRAAEAAREREAAGPGPWESCGRRRGARARARR